MDQTLLLNLAAFSAQVACVVIAGAALPTLFAWTFRGVRLLYWRALAILCLALPWLPGQAARSTGGTGRRDGSVVRYAGGRNIDYARTPAGGDWPVLIAALLAAGCVARLLWMGAGLLYLRRLRSAGARRPSTTTSTTCNRCSGLVRRSVTFRGLTQPVTFGVPAPGRARAGHAARTRRGNPSRRPGARTRSRPAAATGRGLSARNSYGRRSGSTRRYGG